DARSVRQPWGRRAVARSVLLAVATGTFGREVLLGLVAWRAVGPGSCWAVGIGTGPRSITHGYAIELRVGDALELAASIAHFSLLAHAVSPCPCWIIRPSSDLGPSGPRAITVWVCSLSSK